MKQTPQLLVKTFSNVVLLKTEQNCLIFIKKRKNYYYYYITP